MLTQRDVLVLTAFTEACASACLLGFFIISLYISHLEVVDFFPATCIPLRTVGWPKALGVVRGNWAEALQSHCSQAGHWYTVAQDKEFLPVSI